MKKFRLMILALAACFSLGAYADVCSDSGAPSDCQVATSVITFNGVSNNNYNCPASLPYAWGAELDSNKNIWVSSATWADDGKHGIKIIMWYLGSEKDVEFGKATVYVYVACSGTQDKGSGIYVKVG